ncbi:MAG TPA: hypothetical protein PL029_04170 [Bacteroidia bacterium]|nr:hypothetical protein [Bacteroidia bacterium]
MGASVADTVKFIPEIVRRDSWHVRKYVDQELRGLTTYEACKKLWEFIYKHISYVKDERGIETVRSARRLIRDGKGDCDCYTCFIDKCLYELKIPFINRITKYSSSSFQHIYPIVPIGSGKYIVMDCVVDNFNYEQPYTEKEDHPMDLQYLDGIDDTATALVGIDARDLFGNSSEIGELGKLLKRNKGGGGGSAPAKKPGIFKRKTPEQKSAKKQVRKEKRQVRGKKVLKVVNKVNKVNPATVLLRGGILASMKLNVLKVAEKLKWGYATREFAASKGMDMSKYDQLKKVLAKSEKIFYAAGGKPENLKKSILTGKGNKNHEVSGLDDIGDFSTMPELLGAIYEDEFVNGLEGFGDLGQLGEPATAAAITAASGAMGAMALLLKSVGTLFPKKEKKKKGSSGEQAADQTSDNGGGGESPASEEAPSEPLPEEQTDPPSSPGEGPDENEGTSGDEGEEETPSNTDENNEVAPGDDTGNQSGGETEEQPDEGTSGILNGPGLGIKALWVKHKKWLLPVGIGVGVLALAGIVAYATTSKENNQKRNQPALNGPGKHRKKWKGGHGKYEKKSLMALQ